MGVRIGAAAGARDRLDVSCEGAWGRQIGVLSVNEMVNAYCCILSQWTKRKRYIIFLSPLTLIKLTGYKHNDIYNN